MTSVGGNDLATEVRHTVSAYMQMYEWRLAGRAFVVQQVYRDLHAGPLADRSEGFLKRRMYNISQVLVDHGLPAQQGFSPLPGVGREPARLIWAELQGHALLEQLAAEVTDDDETLRKRTSLLMEKPNLAPPEGSRHPVEVPASGKQYRRDPLVRAHVLQQAGGRCELCLKAAPFRSIDGQPFLEVHHVVPLGQGGSDRVSNAAAICPNCHRRCHLGRDAASAVERLYGRVSRLVREPASSTPTPEHHLPD